MKTEISDAELKKTASAWILMHKATEDSTDYKNNFWAFERISDYCESDPDNAWRLIKLIRDMDSSDKVLSNLAAGPLEDLLVKNGELVIGRIQELAHADPDFSKLLMYLWKNEIADNVWKEITNILYKH